MHSSLSTTGFTKIFESTVNTAFYQKENKKKDFLNNYSSKGPIILVKNKIPIAVWLDKKTKGYPNLSLIGKYTFGGGNLRSIKTYSPFELFLEEKREELTFKQDDIFDKVIPYVDYFSAMPSDELGNVALPYAYYCEISSIFIIEVEVDLLFSAFGILRSQQNLQYLEKVINNFANEAYQSLIPIEDFLSEKVTIEFGYSDEKKIRDILLDLYSLKATFKSNSKAVAIDLGFDPRVPFEKRKVVLKKYLRFDNNPFYTEEISDEHVFEARQ